MTRYDNSIRSRALLVAFAAGFFAVSAFAGALEDAKAAFAAGKFGEVDDKLGSLLDKRPVPMEILKLSFDASIKAGRPYTAERRYTSMTEKGEALPTEVLFKAALISGEIGKPNVRRDRLIYFLKTETGWNENVEMALELLCRDGGDGDHYVRLMEREPASEAFFDLGIYMLGQLRQAKRNPDFIKVTDVLLAKYQEPKYVTRIIAEARQMMDEVGAAGFRSDLFTVLVRYPVAGNSEFINLAVGKNEFGPQHVIDYTAKHKQLLPISLFSRISKKLNSYVADEKAREAYAPKFQSFRGIVEAAAKKPADGAANAVFNPDYLQHYVSAIIANPELFRNPGAPVVFSQQDLATLFSTVATAKYNTDVASVRTLANDCVLNKAWLPEHEAVIIKQYPKLFDYRALFYNSKLAEQARQNKNGAAITAILNNMRDRPDIRMQCLPVFFDVKDGAMLKQITEEHIMANPLDFESDNIARYFLCTDALSAAERANFLKALLARTGYSEAWKRLVTFGALPQSLKDDAAFKALVEAVKPEAKGSDPISGALTAIALVKPNGDGSLPAEAFELAKKAIAAYGGQIPNAAGFVKSRPIEKMWSVMCGLCKTKEDKTKLLNTFVRAFGKGADFNGMITVARDTQNQTNFVAAASAAIKSGTIEPEYFSSMTYPKNFPTSVLAQHYKDMTAAAAAAHVNANCEQGNWPVPEQLKQIDLLYASHPVEEFNAGSLNKTFDILENILVATNLYNAQFKLEPFAAALIDRRVGTSWQRARLVKLYAMLGQGPAAISRYAAAADKADPFGRYADYKALVGQEYRMTYANGGNWMPVIPVEKESTDPQANEFGALLKDKLLPAIKAVPVKNAALLAAYDSNRFADCLSTLISRTDGKQSEALTAAIRSFCEEFGLRYGYGMRLTTDKWRVHVPLRVAFSRFVGSGNFEAAAFIAHATGSSFWQNVDYNGQSLLGALKKATEADCWEPAHIVASSVSTDQAVIAGNFQRVRSDCSTHMPGIYPVDESSPMYPLYVAADELERNNPERSWALLNKNLQTFEREASKLPAGFVAWGVEQLRYARGKEDKLLLKARSIATTLLTKESSLTPELAASLMLTRAECYRDQRNYEAAKLEYQSIRNGSYYQGTKAARRAMFRDVDLLIEMGNVSQAEQIIELWLSQPDVEIQAQAHYFLARVAFDRKDYEETRKQLDEVFNLDYTHTDARLLHGKWKLATNSEVDDTAVLVGNIEDRTLIRPGQELTISVQDRNLGVAGGGNSIPIVITTSEGKDVEVLALYPTARNPYLFNGSISTMLGAAVPTNHILEVCGNDEVTYRVEPEFLKARGLETTEPKSLRVVDDARLAIGAAAPLAEEGKAEAALEAMLITSSTEGVDRETLSSNLKPGNPIYVVVRDRDRSLTIQPDKISIDAKTSSGDKLEGIILEETEGSSGIFRGTIPTQLPPPRAFASDSATGVNPGDAINSKRNGVWKSAPDGAQGKWFEVDTMGSYVISNVAIMVPNPEEITSIRLTGRLTDERTVLGTLPLGDISKRYGIHYQVAGGRKLNSSALIRSQFSSDKAVAPKTVLGLAFTPVSNRDQTQNAMISAPFMLPQGQKTVKFRLEANDTKGRTLAGLWMAIAVDGVDVFTGQGNGLHQQQVSIDVEPGPHLLEVFFSASYPDDALTIHVEKDDGTLQQFPADWIDPKAHPALEEFVKDVAVIHKTKGGFQATFSKPMRLRSLRWEFLGYTGREVSVQKLYVQDSRGQLIIPVESDYSDALQNEFLEVAPGDKITVSYNDERTSSGEKRILERTLDSSFHDADVNFFFEEIRQTRNGNQMFLYDAYRFIPGDMLLVCVRDPDGDITPEADKVKVKIETRSGRSANMTLTEQTAHYANMPGYGNGENEGIHGGLFMAQLRTCDAAVTNIPPGTLPIAPGDVITMSYEDRENTKPGVPTQRKVTVQAAQPTEPKVLFFDTSVERVVDTSYDAKLRLEQIKRRPGNENIEVLYKDVISATTMPAERFSGTNALPANVATPIPVMVVDPSRARHEASKINIEVVAQSELDDAEASGRDPDVITIPLGLGLNFDGIKSDIPSVRNITEAGQTGQFSGVVKLHLGPPDPGAEYDEEEIPDLPVNGNDKVRIRVLNDDGSVQSEYFMQLVSAARVGLMDSTYTADRQMAHVGERFFVMVQDADQDTGEEIDKVTVGVTALGSKVTRKVILRETLPHSGIFTGTIRPVIFAPGEAIPAVATGGVAVAEEELADDRIAVRYGDTVEFVYNDKGTIPSLQPGLLKISGKVFKGSDGDVRLFSKHFRDSDMAVLVQFRLAECLFETAKEFRRLKQPERSAEAIDEGKHILEEALRNYPTTIHLVQGEYLLANLYQELATEEKDAGNKKASEPLYSEALSRFSAILSTWPESEFASKAQYHKALCLEMLGDYNRASEEYVKMTYLYPESPLVGDASIRLATYYYTQKRFDTAGRIYANFQKRFPTHEKADRALFMSAQCHMKQAEYLAECAAKEEKQAPVLLMNEEYKLAVAALALLTEQYRETASISLRAQSMYWAGDASLKCKDYQNAYLYLKRTVFEYPETEWARRARGLLLQESKIFEKLE